MEDLILVLLLVPESLLPHMSTPKLKSGSHASNTSPQLPNLNLMLLSLHLRMGCLVSGLTLAAPLLINISDLLLPLDNAIRSLLLSELTGQPPPSDLLTRLFALPARLGGLGIKIPSMASEREYLSSIQATSALSNKILLQTEKYSEDTLTAQLHAKSLIRSNNSSYNSNTAKSICSLLPQSLNKAVSLAQEQGASTWLTVLPLEEHGFSLHKGAFRDALALRYGCMVPHEHLITLCLRKQTYH